ncbi:PREDICTED: membrane-associated tyrosine- and threonine-specific cdc2-inhibitory kinase-like isoform X1 [Branchiostoma belcheri]|uniref:Membrane-associated tyrosine- and threonine-specific cdc2-inhibitory kinase n=1 Tax=Branchiostoma belcheri TaxID=7741 RepID=A0A6P4YI15_BRABE|nr:PREDICTED: membrane-associated tyrosine- and threonine-specific cdc2-inhibitory kinase-like isoform X1 [Branchiostoma belcheri]
MANPGTPRPVPHFFAEEGPFSQKKYRLANGHTPRDSQPPRPPAKSVPPVSRVFVNNKLAFQRPQSVSFRGPDSLISSPHYDAGSKELFFDQCFEIVDKLGEGSFGEVFKVKSKEDGKLYAVKRSRERFRGEYDRKRKIGEAYRLEKLRRHPNCVQFFKAWEERQHLYIQTELCQCSLEQYLEGRHDIPEETVWNFLVDLLSGLKHLHDHRLIHLDIKPDNIFVSNDGVCKIGDFGLVVEMDKEDVSDAQEGDPKYIAPELLEGHFGPHADVFSLGVTILEVACDLELPRNGVGWQQLRQGMIPAAFTAGLSHELRTLIQLMMHPDYFQRPSVADILARPEVSKVLWRRRRQQAVRFVQGAVLSVYGFMSSLFHTMYCTILLPVKAIKGQPQEKQPERCRHPSDWDYSYSEDDAFESEGHSKDSAESGVANLSLSTDEELERPRQFITCPSEVRFTPDARPATPILRHSSPMPRSSSPLHGNHTQAHLSPNLSLVTSHPYTPTSHSDSGSSYGEDGSVMIRSGIGPKNLMNIFDDAACSDDDD